MAKKNQKNSPKKTKTVKKNKDGNNTNLLAKIIRFLWAALILGLLGVAVTFFVVSATKMPDTEELENPDYEYATVIYADDNQELGKYFAKNREALAYEEINPHLIYALIATEDERFRKHCGIDIRSTFRAFVYLGKKGGASTITQQLAKLFFTKRAKSFVQRVWQKLKEWIIALQFEKRYTKNEIIAMYLNKFEFIYGAHGVSAASKTYFGKDQKELTLEEAAVLVGMLKNPYYYNPHRKPENAKQRRNVVLNQMVRNNYLSDEEYVEMKEAEIDMSNFNRETHYEGPAPYFRETIKKFVKNIFAQDKYKKPDGTTYNPDVDGLKIFTTIDLNMQQHAEAALQEHMKSVQKKYRDEWRNKDPWTYDADKEQVKLRKSYLNDAVRNSERYAKMKSRILAEPINNITDKFPDARMLENDIKRMLRGEEDSGYFKRAMKDGLFSKKQASVYKQIMADPLWKELKSVRKSLDKRAAKIFNAKTKMNIFAYNEKGEESVVMSPMDSIRYHQKLMQLGSVSMDPSNGHIKTWVGGIGNKYFKYDHVQSNRQVGSTFKPFLYATAITSGYSPCHKIQDIQHEIPAGDPNFKLLDRWAPENSDGKYTGSQWTLMDGLRRSKNSISLGLLKELAQVNVLEMTAAYSTFANAGVYHEPIYITRIEDSEGRVIYSSVPRQKRIFSEKYNDAMVELLKYASSAVTSRISAPEWGGKTGTTNDHVDGWFMGITPDLVTGTWVGGDYNWIRFRTLGNGAGGAMARPYFLNLMRRLESDPKINLNKNSVFKQTEGDRIVTDCSLYEQKTFPKDSMDKLRKVKEILDQFDDEFDGPGE